MSRSIAVKLKDGAPFTRQDLQYDVLHAIFSDTQAVFTDPFTPVPTSGAPGKLTFRDLYIQAIMKSPKSSKMLKDKMKQTPRFATDFAMLCLLANTGRINTTMSFFPEMKTLIRTYHPIPALQKTSGSLQDAPRIKSILKSVTLDSENKSPPTTPAEILARATSGLVPPTSVPNLIFTLSSFSPYVGRAHLAADASFEFTDLFQPVPVSSASRAKAFLWLCYHYLESSKSDTDDYDIGTTTGNPFCDPERPGNAPALVHLTPEEAAKENVDTEEEGRIRVRLIEQRRQILRAQRAKGLEPGIFGPKEHNRTVGEEDGTSEVTSRRKAGSMNPKPGSPRDVSSPQEGSAESTASDSQSSLPRMSHESISEIAHLSSYPAPFPRRSRSPEAARTSWRRKPYDLDLSKRDHFKIKRSFVEHAWFVVNNSDPLGDSDEENGDAYDYMDYSRRLLIITRLRGKQTTPEPEPQSFREISASVPF